MELEVRVVGGIDSCFLSPPLSLIRTLEKTRGGFLPPMLALELRACSGGACWNVVWSGSASKSAEIELPLASDVHLETAASMTEGFRGGPPSTSFRCTTCVSSYAS